MQQQIKTGLGTAIILIFAITAVYFVKMAEENQADISQPTQVNVPKKINKAADLAPSRVEGWQTYRNEKYGFEFKYPQVFNAMQDRSLEKNQLLNICFMGEFKNFEIMEKNDFCVSLINVKFTADKFELPLWGYTLDKNNLENINVNGVNAYTYEYGHGFNTKVVIIPRGNLTYSLSYSIEGGFNDYIIKYWDQILSTFKFIN